MLASAHRQEDRCQQQDDRVHQSFIVNENLRGEKKAVDVEAGKKTEDGEEAAYRRSVVHQEGTQSPGEAQTQQDVKDIAPYGVGHSHVSHAWGGARQAESKITEGAKARVADGGGW